MPATDEDVAEVGRTAAHGHSQTQRLLSWTVFAVALGANKARREEYEYIRDVVVSANPDDQTGGSVQDHLKSTLLH